MWPPTEIFIATSYFENNATPKEEPKYVSGPRCKSNSIGRQWKTYYLLQLYNWSSYFSHFANVKLQLQRQTLMSIPRKRGKNTYVFCHWLSRGTGAVGGCWRSPPRIITLFRASFHMTEGRGSNSDANNIKYTCCLCFWCASIRCMLETGGGEMIHLF